ncbi:uncharacterized protein LOC144443845 [Glandiceps talaboti]
MTTRSYRRVKQISVSESSEDSETSCRKSLKNGKLQELEEDGHDERCDKTPTSPVRFSRRLEGKSKRKLYIPTRDEVFKSLVPEGTPSKNLEYFRPRKLVNNLLRVHHRYNYDPDYSSSGDIDDFIQYSEEDSDSDSSSTEDKESTSDSESEDVPNGRKSRTQSSKNASQKRRLENSDRRGSKDNVLSKGRRRIVSVSSSNDESDGEDDDVQISRVKKRKPSTSVLTSSDDETCETIATRRSERADCLRRERDKKISNRLAEYRSQRQQKQVRKSS